MYYDPETGERIFPSHLSTKDRQHASEPPTDPDRDASPIDETSSSASTMGETAFTNAPHTGTAEESSGRPTNNDTYSTNNIPSDSETDYDSPLATAAPNFKVNDLNTSSEPTEFISTPQSHEEYSPIPPSHEEDQEASFDHDWLAPETTEFTDHIEPVAPNSEVEVPELKNLPAGETAQPIDSKEALHADVVEVDPDATAKSQGGTGGADTELKVTESDLDEAPGEVLSVPGFASGDPSHTEDQPEPVPEPQPKQNIVSEQQSSEYPLASERTEDAPPDVDETEGTTEPKPELSPTSEHSATAQPTRSSATDAEPADGEEALSAPTDPEQTRHPYHDDL